MVSASEVLEAVAVRPQSAVLLMGSRPVPDDENLMRLLDFFGIPWRAASADESGGSNLEPGEFCVLSSVQAWRDSAAQGVLPSWTERASSVFLYGWEGDVAESAEFLETTVNHAGLFQHYIAGDTAVAVKRRMPEFCGPMSGLEIVVHHSGEPIAAVACSGESCEPILSCGEGAVFFRVKRKGQDIFVSTCNRIIDLRQKLPAFFDVKKFLFESVPVAMYLRWAFREVCWRTEQISACLTVDDAMLTPRYGFLRYTDALGLMDKHGFTAAIAYIPWNWRRAERITARLFRQRRDRLSICFHGCDHKAGEFTSHSLALLNRRTKLAKKRMAGLTDHTGAEVDPIMIFPNGRFSAEAALALKANGFTAMVNTEVAPMGGAETETTIADLWSVAVMRYGTFPIYTRRYPWHGIENVAFDVLLGKPCVLVEHHRAFKAGARELLDFLKKINSLNAAIQWRSLNDLVLRSYRVRPLEGGVWQAEVFGSRAIVANPSREECELMVLTREDDLQRVEGVLARDASQNVGYDGTYLSFRMTLRQEEDVSVLVRYRDDLPVDSGRWGIRYRATIALRRYLGEFRDNWLSRSEMLERAAARMRRLLRSH